MNVLSRSGNPTVMDQISFEMTGLLFNPRNTFCRDVTAEAVGFFRSFARQTWLILIKPFQDAPDSGNADLFKLLEQS